MQAREDASARAKTAISLQDLARQLNLSKGTVSRALNGYSDISAKTKARVVAAAREHGYTPSSTARRLARGTINTVGFVLPAGGGHRSEPFLSEMLDGLSRTLNSQDRDLIIVSAPDADHELEQYERLMRARKVDGFVVARTHRHDARVRLLLDHGFPFVTHGRSEFDEPHAWLDADNEQAFFLATKHLLDLGHRAIGFLGCSPTLYLGYLRERGYRRALEAAGADANESWIAYCDISPAGGHVEAARLLAAAARPTALVCVTDAVAVGALRAIKEAGLCCPADVSVIGYDGIEVGAYADPPLTTMSQPKRRAGTRLAEILLAVIGGEDPGQFQDLWEANLVHRRSDGPPAAA